MIARALRAVANLLDPPKRRVSVTKDFVGTPVTVERVFDDDLRASARAELAASLLDEDMVGYVIVTARVHGQGVRFDPHVALNAELWPAMRIALERLVIESERVVP